MRRTIPMSGLARSLAATNCARRSARADVAEQEEPVRRRVALKIIKLGMDTRNVIARFEAERQALAIMDHPNIAKIFDAGITESAVPDPEGRARHSVRAEPEQSDSGAQGTDAPYHSPVAPHSP